MERDLFLLVSKATGDTQESVDVLQNAIKELNEKHPGWKYIDKIELRKGWILVLRHDTTYNPTKRHP